MSSPLLPPERMALTVARAQIKRGEDPTPNVAAVLIMALARLIDKIGDETLYHVDRVRLAEVNAIPHPLIEEALTMLKDERVLIRVWPEEER